MKNHPSHGCAEREDHARLAERAGRLTRENDGLTLRVESRTHVIAKTFDQICRVLDHLQYIEGEKPTAQGKILTKIYAESDLLLTESIRKGLLDELNATELLSVVSCMIFESRSVENLAPKMPSQKVQSTITEIVSLWAALEEIESNFGVKLNGNQMLVSVSFLISGLVVILSIASLRVRICLSEILFAQPNN